MTSPNSMLIEAAPGNHFAAAVRQSVLKIEDLRCELRGAAGSFFPVDGVSLDIRSGEILALVGESGSGKSLTALAIMRLLPDNARIVGGRILLRDLDLTELSSAELRSVRGRRIGMIFQEPQTSLNPVLTIGDQIMEAMRDGPGPGQSSKVNRLVELLDIVGIAEPRRRIDHYPHQLSGGMKQRVMIAMAIACNPDLLIADEPTTALDVTIQAQILDLLDTIRRRTGMAVLLITHDLGVVAETADRVALIHAGRVLELRSSEEFFRAPQHAYARKLVGAARDLSLTRERSQGAGTQQIAQSLLEVRDLRVSYPDARSVFGRNREVRVVDGVDFTLAPARTLALVGESGCGKTTVGKSILGLVPTESGTIRFEGSTLEHRTPAELRRLRAKIQIIFQDPFGSLDPRMRTQQIVEEGIANFEPETSRHERRDRVTALLEMVGLRADSATRYPHEFSGGQRQRIAIARALAVRPRLIVCDEVTSALDLSLQESILNLLKAIQKEAQVSFLFITHNLATVKVMADEVAIMYLGRIVEAGPAAEVFNHPAHPYTQALLAAEPRIETTPDRDDYGRLEGELPSIIAPPSGCHFHPRCRYRMDKCKVSYPEPVQINDKHFARCFLAQ